MQHFLPKPDAKDLNCLFHIVKNIFNVHISSLNKLFYTQKVGHP